MFWSRVDSCVPKDTDLRKMLLLYLFLNLTRLQTDSLGRKDMKTGRQEEEEEEKKKKMKKKEKKEEENKNKKKHEEEEEEEMKK